MNRQQFCKEFSRRHNMAVTGGTSICIDVLDLLSEMINSEHRVQIDGLGIFKKVKVPSEESPEIMVEQISFEPSKNMKSKRTMPAPVAAVPTAVYAPSALEQAIIDRIGVEGLKKVVDKIVGAPKEDIPAPIPVIAEAPKKNAVKTCARCGCTFEASDNRPRKYCRKCAEEANRENRKRRWQAKKAAKNEAKKSDAVKPSKVNIVSAPNSTINL